MAALQAGFNGIVFTGSDTVLYKLADIGEDLRCTLYDTRRRRSTCWPSAIPRRPAGPG